jgi:hypothetical protein
VSQTGEDYCGGTVQKMQAQLSSTTATGDEKEFECGGVSYLGGFLEDDFGFVDRVGIGCKKLKI